MSWYDDKKNSFPPEFTAATVGCIAERIGGRYFYRGEEFSTVEWESKVAAWERKYKILKRADGSTPQESPTERSASTSKTTSVGKSVKRSFKF